jgi:hypothetical protein
MEEDDAEDLHSSSLFLTLRTRNREIVYIFAVWSGLVNCRLVVLTLRLVTLFLSFPLAVQLSQFP